MEGLAALVATGVVSLFVGIFLMNLQPKAKVMYWSPHSFLFNLPNEDVALQTDALTIQNIGRQAAETVEVVMDAQPDFFQLSPAIPYEQAMMDDDRFVLCISTLGPKEVVTIQLLSYTRVPQILNIRSVAGQAEFMPFQIQRVYPKWLNAAVGFLIMVGFGFFFYWIVRAVLFISNAIGIG